MEKLYASYLLTKLNTLSNTKHNKCKTAAAVTDTSTDNINYLYFNYQTFFATDLVERIKDAKPSRDYLVVNNKDHFYHLSNV